MALVKARILVVEDDRDLREAIIDTLAIGGYQTLAAASAEEAMHFLLQGERVELIVSDVNMGAMSGIDLLRQVQERFGHIPMLLCTAYASISDSVEAMKLGAVDYLVKPFEPEQLLDCVARHIGIVKTSNSDAPIAESASSKQLLALAERVAQSDSTAMIIGESGTGKEVLARYVHQKSARADQPFVAINCAAIPENMLEAMLFGHEKGAYTGAVSSEPGKFEQANGGTLLLDEITEMDIGLQAKLLRVLQEREVERLGGRKTIKLDVRVIATSNRDMRESVELGHFREDLYFRLSVLPLQWLPLRDRRDDILPLAKKLLSKHALKQKRRGVSFSSAAVQALVNYPWPGNVRELDNVMQRALILQAGKTLDEADLGLEISQPIGSPKPSLLSATTSVRAKDGVGSSFAPAAGQVEFASESETAFEAGVASGIVSEGVGGIDRDDSAATELGDDLRRHEFDIIVNTLRQESGSKKNTAERLGISPRTLRYKLARFKEQGLSVESALAS